MTTRASTTRVLAGVLVVGLCSPVTVLAQSCPPELAEAQEKLEAVRSLIRTKPFAAEAPPRSLAGARTDDTARTRLERARRLTDESAAACRAGNMPLSSEKAKAALEALE